MAYFTEAELRDLPNMNDTAKYTTARVTAARLWIEGVIERKVDTSFEARTVTDEVHDGGVYSIALHSPFILSVTSATENGVAVTDTLSVKGGVLQRYASGATTPTLWASGCRNIKVTYQSGYSATPPADIKEAALSAARDWLLRRYGAQGVSDRAMSMQTEMGNIVYATASDKHDRPTGIPEVDAVIMGWVNDLEVFGFA